MDKLTSRQRLLAALQYQEADYLPCCLMSCTILRQRLNEDRYAIAKAELDLGLDPMLFIPTASRQQRRNHPDLRGLPVRFHPDVKVREWSELDPSGTRILLKEYFTPAGTLSTQVRISEDWPHGEHIPFVDDYQVPRALKPLITRREDLEALSFLLTPPTETDLAAFQEEAAAAQAFSAQYGVLLAGGWGVGVDMAAWLCGIEELIVLAMDQPDLVLELLEMIHVWNLARMRVVLSAPVDLYIRRAWYEGCDFVTPRFFRRAILPHLKGEVELAHEHGARFGYICSSGTRPMLDSYLEAGIDVLIGVDPIQGTYTDLPLMKDKFQGRICLWGGVSAAVTVERGSEVEVRAAVDHAIETLGPQGFILSPVDNLTVDEPQTWSNLRVFIDEWQRRR